MTSRSAAPAREGESSHTRSYVLAIVVEVLVIAGLYWLGRHFA